MTNLLTYTLVEQARARYKNINPYNLDTYVRFAYSDYIIALLGKDIVERAHRLFRSFRPDFYDDEGYLKSYEPFVYDCVEVRLSRIAVDLMYKKAERDPELRLDKIEEVREPVPAQMRMF